MLLRLQFEGYAVKFAAVSTSGAAVTVGCSVFLVAFFEMNVLGWVLGQLIGGLTFLGIAGVVAGRTLGPPAFVPKLMKGILGAGLPLIPGSAAVLIMLYSAPYFVGRSLGLEEAGIFGIGYQIGMGMTLATTAVTAAWIPFFQSYVNRVGEASEIFPGLTTNYLAGFGLLVLLFFALAPVFVNILANQRYHDAWQVVGMVAFAHMMAGVWVMLVPGMYFAAETAYISFIQILSAIGTVLVHMTLLPVLGMSASGLAMMLGAFLLVFLQLGFSRWRGYAVRVVQPIRFLVLLMVLIAACIVLWVIGTSDFSTYQNAVASTTVILFYVGLAMLTVAPGVRQRILVALTKGLSRA